MTGYRSNTIHEANKRRTKSSYRESNDQQAFFHWLSMAYPVVFEVTTSNSAVAARRNIKQASRLKREGLKAGFPDIMSFYPAHGYHGLLIELKPTIVPGKPKGKASIIQLEIIEILNMLDYKAAVIWGWEDAATFTKRYVEGIDTSERHVDFY